MDGPTLYSIPTGRLRRRALSGRDAVDAGDGDSADLPRRLRRRWGGERRRPGHRRQHRARQPAGVDLQRDGRQRRRDGHHRRVARRRERRARRLPGDADRHLDRHRAGGADCHADHRAAHRHADRRPDPARPLLRSARVGADHSRRAGQHTRRAARRARPHLPPSAGRILCALLRHRRQRAATAFRSRRRVVRRLADHHHHRRWLQWPGGDRRPAGRRSRRRRRPHRHLPGPSPLEPGASCSPPGTSTTRTTRASCVCPTRPAIALPRARPSRSPTSPSTTSPLHWPKPLDVADDGTIYVGNGGDQAEPCDPAHPFHGGILELDGSPGGSPVAKGFRNPIAVRCPRGHNLCFAIELTQRLHRRAGRARKARAHPPGRRLGLPLLRHQGTALSRHPPGARLLDGAPRTSTRSSSATRRSISTSRPANGRRRGATASTCRCTAPYGTWEGARWSSHRRRSDQRRAAARARSSAARPAR